LIGFCGSDVADPHHAKPLFPPKPPHLDGLPGRSEEANPVKARTILAEVDGITALLERMPTRICSFDHHAQRLGYALLFAGPAPEIGDRAFERQSDFGFAVRVRVKIDHPDRLLQTIASSHEKYGIADR